MALTRTISSIIWNDTVNIAALLSQASPPIFVNGAGYPEPLAFGQQWRFTSDVTIPATQLWFGTLTLSGGALSIDLTALVDGDLGTVDLTGKHLVGLAAQAPSGNAGAITIKPGASNGYTGWVGSGGLILSPKDQVLLGPFNAGTAVSASVKTIDLSGTSTDSLSALMLFG